MAYHTGPKIVTDGLVLCLDAADRNSYAVQPELVTDSNLSTIGDGNFRTCFRDASSVAGLNIGPIISGKTYQIIWNVAARRGTTSASFRKGVSVISGSTNANFGIGLKHHVFTSDQTGTLSFFPDGAGCDFDVDYASLREYQPTINDLSGNLNNGTLTNGPSFSGDNGGSIALDGVSDYVTLSSSTSFSSGNNSRTISLGYLPSQIYTRRTCLFFYGNSGSTAQGFMVSSHTDGKRTQVQTYGNQASSYGNTDWSTSQMNFITVTYDGSIVRYYMNGSLDGAATFSITPNTTLSLSPLIGEHPSGWGGENFAYGKIPFVYVYSKLLTADEVQQNYNATKGRFGL
jgi:hypothetical protein